MERALVEAARRGDDEAFADLMRLSGDRLMSVAYRILRDVPLAEDAVQGTILTAWRELPRLRDPELFSGWLYRILIHSCYREARRDRRWHAHVHLLAPGDAASMVDLRSVDDRDQLDRAFRRLPPEQRAVFVLHHHLGMRQAEIAATLQIPLGTVKSRLHYATSGLRAAVEADDRVGPTSVTEERPA
jgi:RNA polymerase sigma-70 factor (ECF subfamily)